MLGVFAKYVYIVRRCYSPPGAVDTSSSALKLTFRFWNDNSLRVIPQFTPSALSVFWISVLVPSQ